MNNPPYDDYHVAISEEDAIKTFHNMESLPRWKVTPKGASLAVLNPRGFADLHWWNEACNAWTYITTVKTSA